MFHTSANAGLGRCIATEKDLWIRPSRGYQPATKRGVVYLHQGQGTALTPQDWANNSGTASLLHAIASAGYVVSSSDLGGLSTIGNSTGVTSTGTQTTWTRTNNASSPAAHATLPVVAVGISGGFASLINYYKDHASDIAVIIGILPVWDLDHAYQNDAGSLRGPIETAFGITYPTALPAGSDPSDNAANLNGKHARIYYASDDALTEATRAADCVSALGSNASAISLGATGHTDAAIQQINKPDLVAWLKSVAAP